MTIMSSAFQRLNMDKKRSCSQQNQSFLLHFGHAVRSVVENDGEGAKAAIILYEWNGTFFLNHKRW
ncbi:MULTISPECIES: hypothetical protein [unclassified Anoxybacillus]|uniref:hypothetical protein n=1 Tax=unclassified Anoxybacillus TaxID=2639704 RepID=UPI0005CD6AEB|nr:MULTISPECIES: hypothetical protein [unclassified Anoxybacillus]